MAHVRRVYPPARVPLLIVLWLVACTNPISNLAFYEDAELLAALPSAARLGPPQQVRVARVGNAMVLADAVAAAASMSDHVETLNRSGDALREAEPDGREGVSRSWSAVQAAGDIGGDRFVWWVRGDVVRPDDAGDATWNIAVAADASGPWVPVGEGRHDPSGYGGMTWDLRAMFQVLAPQITGEVSDIGVLQVDYRDATDSAVREATVEHVVALDVASAWTVAGESALAWVGPTSLTDPAAQAVFTVLHADEGGWGVGEVYSPTEVVDHVTCWGPAGDILYARGIDAIGEDEGACSTPFPF